MEITELFSLLESNQSHVVEDVKKKFHELFNSCNTNETWLVNGLFDYSMQTGSLRTVEILVGIREPHDTHLFNKFSESLRSSNKVNGLTLLGHVVRRQPTWLFKIARHPLFKELLKLLKTETEIIPLMSALLVVNILLPMVAGLMEPYLHDLFQVFSHLAVWDTVNPNKLSGVHLLHLQMALYALFLRLYGMYPCNFLSYLRQEYSQPHKITIFSHTIKPMINNVKMHPLLITASKGAEVLPSRWRKMEPHDVVVECAKFAIGGELERLREEGGSRGSLDFIHSLEEKYDDISRNGGNKDVWSPTSYCGLSTPPESAPTSIPHTPIAQTHIVSTSFPQQEGTSPPEAAVEATPETTPIKDIRHMVRGGPSLPTNSMVPRALNTLTSSPGHSQPSSPMKKEASPFRFPFNSEASAFHQPLQDVRRDSLISQKVQRIVCDRVQLTSDADESHGMKPRAVLQPTSPLRVISEPGYTDDNTTDLEDKEVESMMVPDNNSLNWNLQQSDSVVEEMLTSDHDRDELEQCRESCTVGGICMPNTHRMRAFTRQVKSRLRYYSQCHPDNYQGLSTGSSPSEGCAIPLNTKVRRTNSCPEIKKTSSSWESHSIKILEEEPSSANETTDQNTPSFSHGKIIVSTGTQTDNILPYEHLFLEIFPAVEHNQTTETDDTSGVDTDGLSPLPQKRHSPIQIDSFVNTVSLNPLVENKKLKPQGLDNELKFCKEQLMLMNLQLNFEKNRREMHAERNRRLLGKCRTARSEEELTLALKDQVLLLQTDNDMLHRDLHNKADEAKLVVQQLQETINYLQGQNSAIQAECTKEKNMRELLEHQLKQEREKTANVTKELNETKASLFNTTNELQQAEHMATKRRDMKESIESLQRELVISGEVHERSRQRVSHLLRHMQTSAESSMLQESFAAQIEILNQSLETQTANLEAAITRINELDGLLAKKDATIVESKRLLQDSKDDFHEQLDAVESKYACLRTVNTRLEAEILELQHQISTDPLVEQSTLPLVSALGEPFHNLQNLVDMPENSVNADHSPFPPNTTDDGKMFK